MRRGLSDLFQLTRFYLVTHLKIVQPYRRIFFDYSRLFQTAIRLLCLRCLIGMFALIVRKRTLFDFIKHMQRFYKTQLFSWEYYNPLFHSKHSDSLLADKTSTVFTYLVHISSVTCKSTLTRLGTVEDLKCLNLQV